MNNNRRYYLHQRIKGIAKYNPISKEISIPNNVDSALKNRYLIELRDVFYYNVQLSIPVGADFITENVIRTEKMLAESIRHTKRLQKSIVDLQNSCDHKMGDGSEALMNGGKCLICFKNLTV